MGYDIVCYNNGMQRMINNILTSKAAGMVVLRSALMVAVMLMGAARLRLTLLILMRPEAYQQRDILQVYLMAKALLFGINPYLPMSELAQKFIGEFTYFPHPAPYPPFNAILFIPLTWLTATQVTFTWYLVELGCLAGISTLLVKYLGIKLHWYSAVTLFFILLAFFPLMADLEVGQLSLLITLLLLASLWAFRRNLALLGGALMGITLAMKLFTWPFLLYFALKRDWRALLTSSLTAIGLNLVALIVLGVRPFMSYYLHISGQIFEIYHRFWANFSLLTWGYRIFEGMDSAIFTPPYTVQAAIDSPRLAPIIALLIAGVCLLAGLWLALRCTSLQSGFAVMAGICLLLSPIVWEHYLVLTFIPLSILLDNLHKASFPGGLSLAAALTFILLVTFPEYTFRTMVFLSGGLEQVSTHGNQFSFLASLPSWLPTLEVLLLTILVWYSDQTASQATGAMIEMDGRSAQESQPRAGEGEV